MWSFQPTFARKSACLDNPWAWYCLYFYWSFAAQMATVWSILALSPEAQTFLIILSFYPLDIHLFSWEQSFLKSMCWAYSKTSTTFGPTPFYFWTFLKLLSYHISSTWTQGEPLCLSQAAHRRCLSLTCILNGDKSLLAVWIRSGNLNLSWSRSLLD